MLAQLGNVPLERISGLVPDFAQRYSTPMIDVRGAVIDGERILLVREATDGCWALPGGYADIGLSAAENIVKEIREEAGLTVTARALYSVTHKAKGLYRPDVRDFYKLYFLCERVDQLAPTAGFETTEVGFFALDDLPPLSRGRTMKAISRRPLRFIAANHADAVRLIQFVSPLHRFRARLGTATTPARVPRLSGDKSCAYCTTPTVRPSLLLNWHARCNRPASLIQGARHMTQQEPGNDYPLSEVPMHARKGLASTAMVLLGFTFFTATMFAGGKLGVAFSFRRHARRRGLG